MKQYRAFMLQNSRPVTDPNQLQNIATMEAAMRRDFEKAYWGIPSSLEEYDKAREQKVTSTKVEPILSKEKETTKVAQNSLYEEYDQMTLRLSSAWNKLPTAEQEKIRPPAKEQSKAIKVFSTLMNVAATFIAWIVVFIVTSGLWDLLAKLFN